MSFSAAHWPGGAMLPSFSVLPGRGDDQGNENPPWALPPLPQISSPLLNGSFVFAKTKPETHPAMAIVCPLLHHFYSDSVRDLVTYTSTCLLEFQGNHLIIFKI